MQLADFPCYVEGFDDGVNLRDLGGWPTAGGRKPKRGLIYRSGRLSDLSTAEIIRLLQLKLARIVDLRPADEALAHPDPRLPSVVCVRADAGRDVGDPDAVGDMSPTQVIEALTRSTVAMAFGNRGIARVLELLLEGRVPLLFHCNSGRDRSGVCAMVVLMALGCSDDVLLIDYLLTNSYRAEALQAVHAAYGALIEAAPEYDELLTLLSGVLPSVGQAVLAEIDARYPSREAYLEAEYGLDEERLVQLRSRYVE
jgi:protein-tyrosine phosphatase